MVRVNAITGIVEQAGFNDPLLAVSFGTFGSVSSTKNRLDCWRRRRMDVPSQLERQDSNISITISAASPTRVAARNFGNLRDALLETSALRSHVYSFKGNVVRVGINYHFSWGAPAPVVAKY